MARAFFVYWRRDQVAGAIADGFLDHAASDQFGVVRPGDTLWIGGRGRQSDLVTIGPIDVSSVISQREAKRRLSYAPWPAKYHALAQPGRALGAREVALDSFIPQLVFESRTRSALDRRKSFGQQLQRMRELTPSSAEKLRRVWLQGVRKADEELAALQARLKKLGKLDVRREVLARREQTLLREFLFRGERWGTCGVCGERTIVELLVAAHIKPRARCSDVERRDPANVMAMCLLRCDVLFGRGLLAVVNGKIVLRLPHGRGEQLERLRKALNGRPSPAWKPERERFFRWHSKNLKIRLEDAMR